MRLKLQPKPIRLVGVTVDAVTVDAVIVDAVIVDAVWLIRIR